MMTEKLGLKLLSTRGLDELKAILASLGDREGIKLYERFGDNLSWFPFGGIEQNHATIGTSTESDRALAERVTNSQDSVLEAAVEHLPVFEAKRLLPTLRDPYAAAEALLGRPHRKDVVGMDKWMRESPYTGKISVVLLGDESSNDRSHPTIDVLDGGIGLLPEAMPDTILSLHRGNKIDKYYLMGRYGQGGSMTLGFCKAVLIASRHRSDPTRVGIVIVRELFEPKMRFPCWVYLAENANNKPKILEFKQDRAISLYGDKEFKDKGIIDRWGQGTLVRHYKYELGARNAGFLAPNARNLYHALHKNLPDPIVAFRISDKRKKTKKPVIHRIGGIANRLRKLANDQRAGIVRDSRSSTVEYYHEFVVSHDDQPPTINVEVFVVRSMHNSEKGAPLVLRSNSRETWVDAAKPFIIYFNGQNHGEEYCRELAKIGLPVLQNHMIILVDLSNQPSQVVKDFFSTSREHLRRSDATANLFSNLLKELSANSALKDLDAQYTSEIYRRSRSKKDDDIEERVIEMLRDAGLEGNNGVKKGNGESGPEEDGDGELTKKKEGSETSRRVFEPIETLPYPEVTELAVVRPRDEFKLRLNSHSQVLIETNADNRFDREGLVNIDIQGPARTIVVCPLRDGRKSWRIVPKRSAKIGQEVSLKVSIKHPTGRVIIEKTVEGLIADERVETTKKKGHGDRGGIPKFTIIPCSGTDPNDATLFESNFKRFGLKPEEASFACQYVENELKIVYCTDFKPLDTIMVKGKPDKAAEVESDYKCVIAFAAVVEYLTTKDDPVLITEEEQVKSWERSRAMARSACARSFLENM